MSGLALRGVALSAAIACIAAAIGLVLGGADAPGIVKFALVVALAGSGGALGLITFGNAGRTVGAVSAAQDRLAAGELGQRVSLASAATGDLTRHFNHMADRVQQLVESTSAERSRLEAVFEASTDAMVGLSHDTTVRLLNSAALRLLGATRDQAIGRPFIETARDYEVDALVRRAIAAAASEASVITFGPARVPLRAVAVPIKGGGDWAQLLILTDLTDVQRLEQVRRDFVSNVSHELRTPLAAIQALVETIDDGNVEAGAETAEFVARIHQQVRRLTSLVNELLDLSRIESGAVVLTPERVDLTALVAEAASLLRTRTEKEDIRIEGPAGAVLVVEADRPSILRVVSNLLDNAIKYSPHGGSIRVSTIDEGELVSLTVTDQGPGIPEQERYRVFERFYTGDASRAASGVGLGLAIVKHLVRAHSGTVEASSTPGEGATFTVKLPKVFVGAKRGPQA